VKTGVQEFFYLLKFRLSIDFLPIGYADLSGDSRRESDRKSLVKVGPLGPLDFVELLKRLPPGSRIAELSKRLPLGADKPTVRNDKDRFSVIFFRDHL
jgi:hypothetical protein